MFYLTLCGGVIFRHIPLACKIWAVSNHYSMLVSFCFMIRFGVEVSRVLWQVNHNLAVLSEENKNRSRFFLEAAVTLLIWILPMLLVIACALYDTLAKETFFEYGRKSLCLMSGRNGQLFFVIVPTGVMVVNNIICVIFSCIQLKLALNSQFKDNYFRIFTKFLRNMVAFQSLQYILGISLYLWGNHCVKIVFETLVAFEGIIIALTYFLNRAKSNLCGEKKC